MQVAGAPRNSARNLQEILELAGLLRLVSVCLFAGECDGMDGDVRFSNNGKATLHRRHLLCFGARNCSENYRKILGSAESGFEPVLRMRPGNSCLKCCFQAGNTTRSDDRENSLFPAGERFGYHNSGKTGYFYICGKILNSSGIPPDYLFEGRVKGRKTLSWPRLPFTLLTIAGKPGGCGKSAIPFVAPKTQREGRNMLQIIETGKITVDPTYQPRENTDEAHIESLTISMKSEGFKPDEAITVEAQEDGMFKVVKGNHRFPAAVRAGIPEIPCFVVGYRNDVDRNLDALSSNLGLPMKPMEEITLASRCIDAGASVGYVASKLGKSVKSLQSDLPITELPGMVKKLVNDGEISKHVARFIAECFTTDGIDPIKAAGKALKAGGNANKQIAVVTAYRNEVFQSRNNRLKKMMDEQEKELEKDAKHVICEHGGKSFTLKNAKGLFDKLTKVVGLYEQSPIGNGHSARILDAKKGCDKEMTTLAKTLKKIAGKLEHDAVEYQAAVNA